MPLTATIVKSTISGNSVVDRGGGVWTGAGVTISIDQTIVDNNYASGRGGGTYFRGFQDPATQPIPIMGHATITNSYITDNVAFDDGGGVHGGEAMTLLIDNTVITGNRAREFRSQHQPRWRNQTIIFQRLSLHGDDYQQRCQW